MSTPDRLQLHAGVEAEYGDVYTPDALAALQAVASLNGERLELMAARAQRRLERTRNQRRIEFLEPATLIPRTSISVRDAREGNFAGSAMRY